MSCRPRPHRIANMENAGEQRLHYQRTHQTVEAPFDGCKSNPYSGARRFCANANRFDFAGGQIRHHVGQAPIIRVNHDHRVLDLP